VVEIGIWGGGSTILYHLLMRPRKMVAIELETEASETLARYIRDNQLENQIVPYYGVDQGDVEAVRGIMLREFGDVQLDVVIDDASHQYALTKRAFNVLFPLLRSGGKYFVEDWGWAHWQGRYQQHWMDDPALSNLIFELTMVVATWGGYMVARVDVQHAFVAVERGTGRLPSKFDISSLYLTRGRKFELL
jgi:hypothetical protein